MNPIRDPDESVSATNHGLAGQVHTVLEVICRDRVRQIVAHARRPDCMASIRSRRIYGSGQCLREPRTKTFAWRDSAQEIGNIRAPTIPEWLRSRWTRHSTGMFDRPFVAGRRPKSLNASGLVLVGRSSTPKSPSNFWEADVRLSYLCG